LRSASLDRLTKLGDEVTRAKDVRFFLDASERLITKPEDVASVREVILDLAVQGRLVQQDAADESASSLLADIVPMQEAAASDENDMGGPSGWTVANLGQLASMITSGSRGWAEYYSPTGASFLRAQNIRFGQLRLDDMAHVTLPGHSEGKRTRLEVGDIVIVITGAGVTNPALVDVELGEAYVSQHVGLVKLQRKALAPWVLLCLMAPKGARDELVARAYGAGKPGLNLDNIRTLRIPIPPLGEQQRIVATVDTLMKLTHELHAALASAQEGRLRLLDAMLNETLHTATGTSVAADAFSRAT
jgi:type I restriction enzyme S subunit